MGRWVDGGSAGGRTPPRLRSERGGTCAQHVHLYNGTLLQVCHFHVRPFSGSPPQNVEIHCNFALWALFEVPAPFRAQPLTAWCIGPFVRTSPNRSGLNDGGGPSTHRGNLWKQLSESFETVSSQNNKNENETMGMKMLSPRRN